MLELGKRQKKGLKKMFTPRLGYFFIRRSFSSYFVCPPVVTIYLATLDCVYIAAILYGLKWISILLTAYVRLWQGKNCTRFEQKASKIIYTKYTTWKMLTFFSLLPLFFHLAWKNIYRRRYEFQILSKALKRLDNSPALPQWLMRYKNCRERARGSKKYF